MSAAVGVLSVTLAVLALVLLVRHRFVIVTVRGASMSPTFGDGDRVVVQRTALRHVRRGAVVIVQRPSDDGSWARQDGPRRLMVKRAAAVPGDVVPAQLGPALAALTGPVPEGRLVVLGDRPEGSFDSRFIGLVPAERLLGVVRWTLSRRIG